MRFDVLTLFPETVRSMLDESIIGRAQASGIVQINTVQIRDFTEDKHGRVDDYPYGGGAGMVMKPQPVYNAFKSINTDAKPHVIYMSPQGSVFNQAKAKQLAQYEHIVILCGHYEGMDERIIEEIVDEEISMGDYVLTGGEIPAAALIDCVCRLVPGVLSGEESYENESHYNGLLEYPQYTRPPEFMGRKVPDVLLSGHHDNINKWRLEQMKIRTRQKRPDMIKRVGVLGGTFNPVHTGHIAIAKAAMAKMNLDYVLVVPNGDPPHKDNDMPSEEHRYNMVEIALKDEKGIIPCDVEIGQGVCYTVNTLNLLRDKMPYAELYYIIGGDNMRYMSRWKKAEKLLKDLDVICVTRTGYDMKKDGDYIENRFGARVHYAPMEPVDVSSTQIRENVEEFKDYLHKDVYSYIKENNLYGKDN